MKNMKSMLVGMSSVIAVTIGLSVLGGANVNAAPDVQSAESYSVWVGGTEVTSLNKDNVLKGDPVNDGKVKYDADTHTLSFEDAVITTGYEYDDNSYGIYCGLPDSFIYLDGSVSISGVDVGIHADGEFGIINEGLEDVLDIKASNMGIEAGSLRLDEAKVDIAMTSDDKTVGIVTLGEISVTGTEVTIAGANYGIIANDNIHIGGEEPKLNICSLGSCIFSRGGYVYLFSGDIYLKTTGEESDSIVTFALAAKEVMTGGTAAIKIDSSTSGIAAYDNLSVDGSDLRIDAAIAGIASSDVLSINMADSSNCVEIDAVRAVAGVEINIDTDIIRAPENVRFVADDTEYKHLANEDGTFAKYVVINGYDLTYVEATEPTTEKEGNIAYYQAGSAGDNKIFEDALGAKEIKDKSSVIIPKLEAPKMPDVKGMKRDEAKALIEKFLKDNNIEATINIGYGHNSDPARNLVVASTTPNAGESVGASTKTISIMVYEGYNFPTVTVTPTVTEAPAGAAMPDVKGMKRDEAKALIEKFLKDNNIEATINIGYGHNSDPAKNLVVASTTPDAGETVDASTKSVTIMVYEGYNFPTVSVTPAVNGATMPDVKGMDRDEAKALIEKFLKDNNIEAAINIGYGHNSDPAKNLLVASTTPNAGETVDASTKTISIMVYEGYNDPSITPEPTITDAPSKDPKDQIGAFVDRIYKYVLDREPEEEGANFWTNELYSFKRTGAEVGLGFIFSDEFVNRNLSDEDFVTVLYNTFFGREPEEGGFAFWTGALKDGTLDRMAVAGGFIYSQEWADTCASYGIRSGGDTKPSVTIEPTDATYAFVERMYTTAMNRASDEEGAKFWAGELANFNFTGEQVGVMFFLSEEMQNFNLDNKEFVTRLYKTFMDRDPEEGGFNFWVKYLEDGGSREGAVLGFTRSEEFVNKCVDARILPF